MPQVLPGKQNKKCSIANVYITYNSRKIIKDLSHRGDILIKNNPAATDKEKVKEIYQPVAERNLKWYLIRNTIIKNEIIENISKISSTILVNNECIYDKNIFL